MNPFIISAWIAIGFAIGRLHAEATIIRRLKIRIDQLCSRAGHRKCQERKPIVTAKQKDGFVAVTYEDRNE